MSKPSSSAGPALAILGYHKVGAPPAGGWDTWFYIPEQVFAEQLAWLREHAWEVIDLERFLAGLRDPASLPARAALITFDDGYRSNLEIAVPWLRRFAYPAVMFVPTDYIGGRNSFDRDAEPDEAICGWAELAELERHGVAIQSHGAAHRRFSELTPREQEAELMGSKSALESGLGRRVDVVSFPYGDAGTQPCAVHDTLRRVGYRAACLYGGGPNPLPISHPYALTRLAMGPDSDLSTLLAPASCA